MVCEWLGAPLLWLFQVGSSDGPAGPRRRGRVRRTRLAMPLGLQTEQDRHANWVAGFAIARAFEQDAGRAATDAAGAAELAGAHEQVLIAALTRVAAAEIDPQVQRAARDLLLEALRQVRLRVEEV